MNMADWSVLLVNLGTPGAPTAAAVRRYLAEFLIDPRVVDYQPRWLWWLILHGVILRLRPARSARAYAKVWRAEGSPLRVESERLGTSLQAVLAARCESRPRVALAMRYGGPAVADVLRELQRAGTRRVLVLPLYPQYSGSTTGSVADALDAASATMRHGLQLRTITDYHDDPGYLDALAASVRGHWQQHGRGERLLLSFHGVPERYVCAGDPYLEQCRRTAQGLRERLQLSEQEAILSFQSRVGREPWLQPYTDATVRRLAGNGIRRLDVISPGFAVDCLETLEELALRNRDYFLAAGGESLSYIPALNASIAHVEALAALVLRHSEGWRDTKSTTSTTPCRHPGTSRDPY